MSTAHPCPECGAALPGDAAEGGCPVCALEGALAVDLLPDVDALPDVLPLPRPGGEGRAEGEIGPTVDIRPEPSTDAEHPSGHIGRYKLLQQIGEGGCGIVYLAEQAEPVRRRVALKVIKPGMDTRQVIARFEAERQALAMMDHPNIAKVFDGGMTETGRPFFVMELVRGVPITEYCDGERI